MEATFKEQKIYNIEIDGIPHTVSKSLYDYFKNIVLENKRLKEEMDNKQSPLIPDVKYTTT